MPLYMIKFKEFATAVDRRVFMSEIEGHGGVFMRRNLLQEGYLYDVPEDTLDEKDLKMRETIEFSERQPRQYLED